MGWFDGFPFTTKEDRERRRKDFEKRITPFGAYEQREKLKTTLTELFPGIDITELLFAYYNAKDSYTVEEDNAEGIKAARYKLRDLKWLNENGEKIMLKLIEMECGIKSLEEFPTAAQVLKEILNVN